VTDLNTFGGCD